MNDFYTAFISYGRADSKALAVKLRNQLTELDYRVWFDVNDIPVGVDYQKQIDDGIEKAHNFLFIISPHAINSDYCRLEIEQAVRFNKRIIPLLHVCSIDREIWQQRNAEGTDEEWAVFMARNLHRGDDKNPNMHSTIAKINWVPLKGGMILTHHSRNCRTSLNITTTMLSNILITLFKRCGGSVTRNNLATCCFKMIGKMLKRG